MEKWLLLLPLLLLMTACGNEKVLTCTTSSVNVDANIRYAGTSKVYEKDGVVHKHVLKMKAESDEKEALEKQKQEIEDFLPTEKMDGLDTKINEKKGELNLVITIDLNKIDVNAYIEKKDLKKHMGEDDKLKIEHFEKMFQDDEDYTCKKS